MGKILYTKNIPFSMEDWEIEPIQSVYAGIDCIMAITEDGRVLQKCLSDAYAARCAYWTRTQQISLSKCVPGAAIGLIRDGTCMISKRALRHLRENGYRYRYTFESINDTVRSRHDIIQVAVSDAFFALDRTGRVHHITYTLRAGETDPYRTVSSWKDVQKIVTGLQGAVFGITKDGRILCAGANCSDRLSSFDGIVDLFPTGSECEEIILLTKDGKLISTKGTDLPVIQTDALDGTFWYTVIARTADKKLIPLMNQGLNECPVNVSIFPEQYKISSFAVGQTQDGNVFVIAAAE